MTSTSLPSRISTDIDFDRDGKQISNLVIPYSRNESAWGSLLMPIAVVKNGAGPTLLLTGGSHGDEYEGPIALAKLVRTLEPENLRGRIIVLPALNYPALRSGTRLSPIDGGNMNRVFPGSRTGTVTPMIAHYVYTELLPLADVVLDMHSGGSSLEFIPSAICHRLENPDLMAKTLAALTAFGAPVGLILEELDMEGMLDSAVENQGKLFLSTELGGGATLSPVALQVAERGLQNLLVHLGMLSGAQPVETPQTRLMEVPDGSYYVIASEAGIYEPFYQLGDEVRQGEPIGQIHFLENLERSPQLLIAQQSGTFFCRRVQGKAERGDCVAVIARELP
ncbi:N-alpha-acetyl diaminobutyric acid deacetylase DoeB [filamentous cyanobacterium CCP5]|nr:N-alpha-acetyl diaminobutyric acid deacetylase DoeB [filamentous cyanobacterium CCP5]